MQDAKKFLLVESNDLNRLFRENLTKERLQPLPTRELHQLDSAMLDIVNTPSMSQEEKVKKYNSILTEFQSVAHYNNPPRIQDSKVVDKPSPEAKPPTLDPILGVPTLYKRKAENLMTFLKQKNQLSVSDKGEVIIKDEKIDKSNVTDILNKAVNPKSNLKQPTGWTKFQELMEENNVPKSMVSSTLTLRKEHSKRDKQPDLNHSGVVSRSKRIAPAKRDANPLENWTSHDSSNNHGQKKKKKSAK